MYGFLIFVLIYSCVPASAFAQATEGPVLTLEKTLQRVYLENPDILAARYSLEAVKELHPQAVSGWRPNVNAEASVTSTRIESGNFSTGDGATTKGASINIEQPLFRGFRTVAEIDAAKKRIAAEEETLKQTQQATFLESVEAYMNVIRDRMLLELQRRNVALLQSERESALARFEAGDITQTDVKQTEARYSNALADDAVAESKLQQSEAEFERVTGGVTAAQTMVMPVIKFSFPPSMERILKDAELNNPSILQARFDHLAAKSDIRTAKSGFYPQVTAFASHLKEYDPQPGLVDESETSTIGLRARINLYEGGNNLSRVRQARARANQRYVDTIREGRAVTGDIKGYWYRLKAYDAEIKARELEIAAAQFSRDGVREEARLGDRTVLDTLEAEQEVLDAQSALVLARRDKIVTAYRLAAGLGMLVPEQLGLNGQKPLKADMASSE